MSENTIRVTFVLEKEDYEELESAWKRGKWPSRSAFIKHCILQRIHDGSYGYFSVPQTYSTDTGGGKDEC